MDIAKTWSVILQILQISMVDNNENCGSTSFWVFHLLARVHWVRVCLCMVGKGMRNDIIGYSANSTQTVCLFISEHSCSPGLTPGHWDMLAPILPMAKKKKKRSSIFGMWCQKLAKYNGSSKVKQGKKKYLAAWWNQRLSPKAAWGQQLPTVQTAASSGTSCACFSHTISPSIRP